ncbi:hypothetical protein HNV12_07615 [Methanococcoides sp. SA1]|nr:hypothetical protein [Methanococcoides sp. SA1]
MISKKMFIMPFLLALYVLVIPSLAVTNSVEVSGLDNISYEGWLKEEVKLSANEEIELGNYTLNYIYPQNGGYFVEELSIQEKKKDAGRNEKLYKIAAFSGHEDIYDIKGKVVFIERSSLAFRIDEIEDTCLMMTIWSTEYIFSDVEISANIPDFVQFYKDESVSIPLKINNSGSIDETFDVEVNGSGFYSYEFIRDGYKVSKINVDSGEIGDLSLKLHIDKNCPVGDYKLNITAFGRSSDSLEFPFTVIGDINATSKPELATQLSSLYVSGEAGAKITVPVRIFNTGNVDLKDIEVYVDLPSDNWDVEFSENKVGAIKSEEYITVDITVSIPSGTENGDYFVDINAKSGDTKTDDAKLRVNVKNSSNSAWIGLSIVILLIAVLVFAAKKYGRR